jgi:NAD(P)H-hydrate epimerase
MMDKGLSTPLYRAASVREFDRIAIDELGIAGSTLMERAGRAAFQVLLEGWPSAGKIAVVCGRGNNAGDGYVLARLAVERGIEVIVAEVGDPAALRGDALAARKTLENTGATPVAFSPQSLDGAAVIVDGIFGTGLDREVEEEWRAAIEAVNAATAPVLALDIPSGLHADTGRVMGESIRAAATVSFIGLKRGSFTGQGRARCGRIHYQDLGVPEGLFERCAADAYLEDVECFHGLLGPRPRDAHKGRFGHVLVVGGESGFCGAARLAAEAALRCGAGLVSVATRTAHAGVVGLGRPEIMCHGVETAEEIHGLMQRASVLAVGPGLGQAPWGRSMLDAALEAQKPLVLDADGLNLFAKGHPAVLGSETVITPHPAEAARLLGVETAAVEADRYEAVEALARKLECVCVLKGAGTLVSAPGGVASYVCRDGNPGMATGGMGDVLTGVVAALMAQAPSAELAARAGVCLHARAGDVAARGGERGTLASDLLLPLRAHVNDL